MIKRVIALLLILILLVGCGDSTSTNKNSQVSSQKGIELTYEYRNVADDRYDIVFYGVNPYNCPIDLRDLHIVVRDEDGNITDESDKTYMSIYTIEPNKEFLGTYLDYENEKEPKHIEVTYNVEKYENFECIMDDFEITAVPDYQNRTLELTCTNNYTEKKSIHFAVLYYYEGQLIFNNEGYVALDLEPGKTEVKVIDHYEDFDDYKIFYSIYD